MAELNGLPVYKIKIDTALDSNEGIDFISLVDYPAIESNWVKFGKENKTKYHFDQEKQMLYGAILIPNQPIYRYDEKIGEYYVVFEEQTIIDLVRKFQTQKKTVNLNYQHQNDSQIKDAVVQEIWLTGKVDKSQTFGFDFPINTAMVGVFVGDSKFWNEEVKTGNVKGFSIEGWLDMAMSKDKLVSNLLDEIKKLKKQMNNQKFVEASTEGGALKSTAETWTVGEMATFTGADGTEVPADGDYKLDDGTVIKCAQGKIMEIVQPQAAASDLTPEETAVLNKALKPQFDAINAQIEEMKALLKKMPATPVIEKKDEKKPTAVAHKMSVIEKIRIEASKQK